MAFPTAVNSEITDSVAQANVQVLGDAPATAMGNLYIATSQALSNAAHNAATQQQNSNMIAQAATTQGVALIYSVFGSSAVGTWGSRQTGIKGYKHFQPNQFYHF